MADEKKVETYLVQQVEKRGGLCVKFPPVFFAGFPDRMVLTNDGVTIYVETKAPHIDKVDPLQRIVHGKLRKRGHRVEVINTKAGVDDFVNSIVW